MRMRAEAKIAEQLDPEGLNVHLAEHWRACLHARRVQLDAIHLVARGGLPGALAVQIQLVQEHDEDEHQRDGSNSERRLQPDHNVTSNGITSVKI